MSFYKLIDADAECIDEFAGYDDKKAFNIFFRTKTIKFVEDGMETCFVMDADKGIRINPENLRIQIDYDIHKGDKIKVFRDVVNRFLYFSKENLHEELD